MTVMDDCDDDDDGNDCDCGDDDGCDDDDCRLVECSAPCTSDAHGPIRLSK